MEELAALSIRELLDGYARRRFVPREVLEGVFARIERVEPGTQALVARRFDEALAEARAPERGPGAVTRPLAGIPFVAKDLLDAEGLPTRCGSRTRAAVRPARRDAVAVALLRKAGAILVAKSRTHEFGWGITTVSDDGTATANPADPTRIAGGSSGGSAAALAAGEVPLALGTDTAGSVRIPADFCGVVGLRPSRGTISALGAFPLAPSLDEIGPMTRTPGDAEIALDVLAPRRRADPSSRPVIGVLPNPEADGDPTRIAVLERVVAAVSDIASPIRQVDVPAAGEAFEIMGTIILAEGLATHRREGLWPTQASTYGADVRARLELAEGISLTQYVEAVQKRETLRDKLALVFAEIDILLSLNSAVGPIRIDEPGGDPTFRRAVMGCTAMQSLCGLPACAVPAGVDGLGMPVGVQVTGAPGADREVLRVARFVHEAGTNQHCRTELPAP